MNKTIDQMSDAEIKEYLDNKEKKERAAKEKARKEYESSRDKSISDIMSWAETLASELNSFKQTVHEVMTKQETKLQEYGEIRANSKGGFSITNTDATLRVVRRRDTEPQWDERAEKAIILIKDFLYDTVKKRDTDMFEILLGFLEKNQKGDLEYAKVFSLMRHRNKFSDERWKEGLQLLEESFSNHLKGWGYEFKTRDEQGKWENLVLNFSSL